MKIIEKPGQLQSFAISELKAGRSIGLVPTMGNLHEGHLSLIRQARKDSDTVIATLFVNPTQFGPGEDLEKYPRTFQGDCDAAEAEGCDILFAPQAQDVYPEGYQTFVEVGPIAGRLCGASRPGHFRGVATVVLKLFNLAQPTRAYFGMKDYQQLLVVRTMARDFNLPVDIVPMPTVREADGLAMSSRNAYLSPSERTAALCLSRGLFKAREMWAGGERRARRIREAVESEVIAEPLARVDYIEVCHPDTLEPVDGDVGRIVILLAVFIGTTRLIDNILLES